jgi:hypothetical protein
MYIIMSVCNSVIPVPHKLGRSLRYKYKSHASVTASNTIVKTANTIEDVRLQAAMILHQCDFGGLSRNCNAC